MDFLMAAFERVMRGHRYNFRLIKNKNGTYTLHFYDLPPELDLILSRLTYFVDLEQEEIKDKYGRVLETRSTAKNDLVFSQHMEGDVRSLKAEFYLSDYAKKINKIEYTIKEYHASRSHTPFTTY